MRILHHFGVTQDGSKLELPDDAVTEGFGFWGQRGTGKTNTVAVFMEILAVRKHPFIILDPPDAHWGIRYEAGEDGQPVGPSGLDVLVIGGPHGDVDLNPERGKELANILVDGNISAVICMKSLGYTQRMRFCGDFGEELFRINHTPRWIGFEECQNFLPQNIRFDEQKRVLLVMERFISEGRGSGLGFGLVSQRLSKVNKDATEEVQNFFAMRLMGANDIKQLVAWFKWHVEDKEKLETVIREVVKLKPGEAWFLSPVWMERFAKITVRKRVTYHSGRTPKPGERTVSPAKFGVTEAVEKLKKLFAQKSVAVQADVADMREAKARIRELERELKTAQHAHPAPAKGADKKAIDRAVDKARREVALHYDAENAVVDKHLRNYARFVRTIVELAAKFDAGPVTTTPYKIPAGEIQRKDASRTKVGAETRPLAPLQNHPRPDRSPAAEDNGELSRSQRAILKAIAEFEAIGRKSISKSWIAARAGASYTSSTFGNNLGFLRSNGYIAYPGPDLATLTDKGRDAAGAIEPPQNSEELLESCLALLSSSQQKILRELHDKYPSAVDKTDLAEMVGASAGSSTYGNNLGALRSAGMIEYPAPGQAKCADWLFLE